jgi:glycosyltransferase involved in cell wall biosynthesis
MSDTRLLFITRTYPPQVGGMERYSRDLYHALKQDISVDLLKHGMGKMFLPFFAVRCLLHIAAKGNKYTHIHFGDAVLAPLALLAKLVTQARISTTVHALDVIYDNPVYQWVVPRCLARLDRVVAVSKYTLEQCVLRGVDRGRCHVIPNGIDLREVDQASPGLETVLVRYNIDAAGKRILFSIGRLIKRKGIQWFVSNVLPLLGDEYIYLIAGQGPESAAIARAVSKHGLEGRVYLLGRISDEEKFCLYRNAYLYIMPNIPVPGDAEGFGITIIEAAVCGLPAIASDLEGIPDAMINGATGTLVEQLNHGQYAKAIIEASFDRDTVSTLTINKYAWSILKRDYLTMVFC